MVKAAPLDLSELLRVWRVEVAGVAASDVAATLGVARSAVANWESGLRAPSSQMLGALDSLYNAGGALVDLAGALGSPRGLQARSQWWHNYDARGGPVWAWARCDATTAFVRLRLRWGPLSLRVEQRFDSRGLIVTVPASVANPPVQAEVDPPGWVDFGQGRIPRQLEIRRLGAFSHVNLVDPADHALWIIASRLRPALNGDGRWIDKLKTLLGLRGDLVEDSLTQAAPPTAVTDVTGQGVSSPNDSPYAWSGARYRTLRKARGLSQSDAATHASALAPAARVSDDQIAVLEAGGHPRVPDLRARLDVIYRADGQSLRQILPATRASDGTVVVNPPPWWTGPIWLTPNGEGTTAPGEIGLRWPPWEHRLRLHPGTVLTTRMAPGQDQPLVVELPPGWSLSAGLGARPDAVGINYGWHAIDTPSVDQIFNHYHRVYLELFNKTQSDLMALLRSQARIDTSH